jgi:serine protease Do
MGLSFSIPIDVALEVSNQLKVSGKVNRGWLGIVIQELSKDLAESFGMKNTNGALVAAVEKNGPADKGGLEAGDVIVKFDGKLIVTSSDLPRAVAGTTPGKTVPVEVLRKGSQKLLNVATGEMPTDGNEVAQASKPAAKAEANRVGLVLREATPQQRKKLNGKNGLIVVDVQGPAAQAGVRRGDVILGLNNSEVQTLEQFNKQLAAFAGGKSVALLVLRGENTLYVPVKIPTGK